MFKINEAEQFQGIAGTWIKCTVHNFCSCFVTVCSPLFFHVHFLPTFMELSYAGKNMSKNTLTCYLPEYSWKRNFRLAQLRNSELYILILSGKKILCALCWITINLGFDSKTWHSGT